VATRAEIIAEARSYIGTPWQHQGRLKGVGVDCAGVVVGVGKTCGVISGDSWALGTGYGRQPNPIKMKMALDALLDRVRKENMLPGDVAWLRAGCDLAQHLGIFSERNTLIHAVNYQVVQELPIEATMKRKNLVAVYRYRGLDD
jgi:cell wall-associated NlpC family hydrolase